MTLELDLNNSKKDFIINSLWSIGMSDPFPDEDTWSNQD
jgi:hypothetical protein